MIRWYKPIRKRIVPIRHPMRTVHPIGYLCGRRSMLMICNSFRLGEGRFGTPFPQFLYLVGIVSVHLSLCVTHGTLVKGTLKEKMRCLVSFPQVDFLNEEVLTGFFIIEQVVFHLVGAPFSIHFLPKSWQNRHCPAAPNISLLTLLVRATERLR